MSTIESLSKELSELKSMAISRLARKEPPPPKKLTIPNPNAAVSKKTPATAVHDRVEESPPTLRLNELAKKFTDSLELSNFVSIVQSNIHEVSPHGEEIIKLGDALDKELVGVTSKLLKIDKYNHKELFDLRNLFQSSYIAELLLLDLDYAARKEAARNEEIKYGYKHNEARENEEYLNEDFSLDETTRCIEAGKSMGRTFFEKIMTQVLTLADYTLINDAFSKPLNISSSKNPKSKTKKTHSDKEFLLYRVRLYDLRERIRAPEVQAAIKKIIEEYTAKAVHIIMSPTPPSAEQRLEECEAKAERYRKAFRLSVGIPNDPVKTGGRRTVKRRRVTGTKA